MSLPAATVSTVANEVASRGPLCDAGGMATNVNADLTTTVQQPAVGDVASAFGGDSTDAADKENGAATADGSLDASHAKVNAPIETEEGATMEEDGGTAPDRDEAAEEEEEEEEEDDDEEEEEDEDEVGADGLTAYERERQRNIQRNRELMQQLALSKMAEKLNEPDPNKPEQKKRGPKAGWKKKRGQIVPSRGSSRIQALQEERKHTAWKDVHVDTVLRTHPHIEVELDIVCLGVAHPDRKLPDGSLIPAGFFAEGALAGESLIVWTDMNGKHHMLWGEAEGKRQRHVATEEGGANTPAGASLCIMRELQWRRLEMLGATPATGVCEPQNIRMHHSLLPPLTKPKPLPESEFKYVPQLPRSAAPKAKKKLKTPKDPKTPYFPPSRHADVAEAPECHNCKCKREDTTRMRYGPAGPKTLCNACGMYWATQGRVRPHGAFNDDYERKVPEGVIPAVTPCARVVVNTPYQQRTSTATNPAGAAPDTDDKPLSELASRDSTPPKAEEEDEEEDDEEDEEEDEESEEEGAETAQLTVDDAAQRKPSFFTNMVKCAAAGIITPAMVGADEQPLVYDLDSPPPRWCPHLYAGLPPLVGISDDACAEVKLDPQGSLMRIPVAAVADSDPVKAVAPAQIKENPFQAHNAYVSAAVALAGWGGLALIGSGLANNSTLPIYPTSFVTPKMVRPRVYVESDVDGVTMFGYTEADVQMALQAQLEKYQEKLDTEGEEAEKAGREEDIEEATDKLEQHVSRAIRAMKKEDARAEREAKFERAAPRIAMATEAKILCPPLPKPEKPKVEKGTGRGEGGGKGDANAGPVQDTLGFLYEESMEAIQGQEEHPSNILVMCGCAVQAELLTGGRPREEKIRLKNKKQEEITPADYERLGGHGSAKKWRKSIRIVNEDGSTGIALGDHLAKQGAEKGETVIGRRIGIWWPLDQVFYLGHVEGFTAQTGEHTVRYDDGETEDLLLHMQRIKWLPQDIGFAGEGVLTDESAAAVEAKAAEEAAAAAEAAKAAMTPEELAWEAAAAAAKKAAEEAAAAEAKRIEDEAKGILSPEGRSRVTMGAFDVWAARPAQWRMRNSERRKCMEVLTILKNEVDPDDDPDDEEEPPRLLIEPFEKLPSPRELPDYYELIRCPVDVRGIERILRRPADRSYASPWFFACAVELMLTNAQVYNDEDSQLHEEAIMLRRAFIKAMREHFPGQPLPTPFKIYESCDEPAWLRPSGWTAPGPEDVQDEPDPFEALDWEVVQAEEDEERALARAIKAGGTVYGGGAGSGSGGGGGRGFGGRGGGRGGRGGRGSGRGPGRPKKNFNYDDDRGYDPKKAGGVGSRGSKKRKSFAMPSLGVAATAAKEALEKAGGEALTLDDLVTAAEKAKAPELAGARRPGSTVLSVLRQHPDVFVESLTGTGTRFTLNKRLAEYDDSDSEEVVATGPSRTSGRTKLTKTYADPDDDDDFYDDDEDEGGEGNPKLPWKSGDVKKRKRSHRGGGAEGSALRVKLKRGDGGGSQYEEEEFYDEYEEEDEEPKYEGMSPVHTEACKTLLANLREKKDKKGRVVGELFERLPTRKQLPDYYRQIAHPIDFESIAKCLNRQGGYESVWKFLLGVELMLSNCQVYNEENSELWKDAATLRKTMLSELDKVFPGHPYPEPFSVYDEKLCQEPEWEPPKVEPKGVGKKQGGEAGGQSKKAGPLKVSLKMGGDKGKAADKDAGGSGSKLTIKMKATAAEKEGKREEKNSSKPLKVTMKGEPSAPKPTPAKPAPPVKPMPEFPDCGECANCGGRTRGKRCLDVQMRQAVHIGHEGARIAARGSRAVGASVEVYWPDDDSFYPAKITGYDEKNRMHQLTYVEDGVVEDIHLWGEKEVVKLTSRR